MGPGNLKENLGTSGVSLQQMLPKLHSREDVFRATGKYRVAWRNRGSDRGPCSDSKGSRSRQQGEAEDRKELEGPGSWRQGTEEDHLGEMRMNCI